jgi:hypothetical protein
MMANGKRRGFFNPGNALAKLASVRLGRRVWRRRWAAFDACITVVVSAWPDEWVLRTYFTARPE